jgi:hypothetical protein
MNMQYTRPTVERRDSVKGLMTNHSGKLSSISNDIS